MASDMVGSRHSNSFIRIPSLSFSILLSFVLVWFYSKAYFPGEVKKKKVLLAALDLDCLTVNNFHKMRALVSFLFQQS